MNSGTQPTVPSNSGLNLPAFLSSVLSSPPTVARRTRANFTVGGCLAT